MQADVVVIGAGVVGLAVARLLAAGGRDVVVLEAEKAVGSQTSARNSEVVHAGLYYPTGSLKARTCVAGARALYAFCDEMGVAARRLGKLIVARDESQIARLQQLYTTGLANGVGGLVWLDGAQAMALEPELRCVAALHSTETGIVDSAAFMLALRGAAESLGAQFALRTRVASLARSGIGFTLSVEGADELLDCRAVVNCAGHGAHDLARSMPDYPAAKIPPRYYAKGNYCSVSGRAAFSRLIYPLPVEGGLGVHVTLDLGGQMRLGPNVHWVDSPDTQVSQGIAEPFRAAVAPFWPGVASREITPVTCGVRPKISGPGEQAADFRLDGPSHHGIPGLVHCFGIESPGLTASLALAELIVRQLD